MSKRQIATEIVENMIDLDLINTMDYNLETAKADAIEVVLNKLDNYIMLMGNVIDKEPPATQYDYVKGD